MSTHKEAIHKVPTSLEVARAVTNDPALALYEFTLGDRQFKVVDLEYDDLCEFTAYLEPFLGSVVSKVASMRGANMPSGMDAAELINKCGKILPEMVKLICRQTDPDITTEQVKKLGKSPFKLASIVVAQIKQNRMVSEIADFFGQMLPLLSQGLSIGK